MHSFTQVFNQGGGRSGQRYLFNLLAPRPPKTTQRPPTDPPKGAPRHPKTPTKTPQRPLKTTPKSNHLNEFERKNGNYKLNFEIF